MSITLHYNPVYQHPAVAANVIPSVTLPNAGYTYGLARFQPIVDHFSCVGGPLCGAVSYPASGLWWSCYLSWRQQLASCFCDPSFTLPDSFDVRQYVCIGEPELLCRQYSTINVLVGGQAEVEEEGGMDGSLRKLMG